MTTVRPVVSVCLPVPQDNFPGCISPPVAVPRPHLAAPWLTGHTGGGRSKYTQHVKKKKNQVMCCITEVLGEVCVCAHVHTPYPELCVCPVAVADRES